MPKRCLRWTSWIFNGMKHGAIFDQLWGKIQRTLTGKKCSACAIWNTTDLWLLHVWERNPTSAPRVWRRQRQKDKWCMSVCPVPFYTKWQTGVHFSGLTAMKLQVALQRRAFTNASMTRTFFHFRCWLTLNSATDYRLTYKLQFRSNN